MEANKIIQKALSIANISLNELKKRTDLSYSYLFALKHNKYSPTLTTIKKIADAVGITVSKLLEE